MSCHCGHRACEEKKARVRARRWDAGLWLVLTLLAGLIVWAAVAVEQGTLKGPSRAIEMREPYRVLAN